jgi:hypothetical protein
MTPPDCDGRARGCTEPPNKRALAPSPAEVIEGVFSIGVRSTNLQEMSRGKEWLQALPGTAHHPAKFQTELAFDES